jgi:hypothetical protein
VAGYLSHLVGRLSGAKPALRPRIASIFEPVSGATLAVAPDREGLRVVEQERIVSQPPAPLPPMARVEAEPRLTPRADSLTATPDPRPALSSSRRADSFQEVEATGRAAVPPRPRSELRAELRTPPEVPLPLTDHVPVRPEVHSAEPKQESHPATPQPAPRTLHSEVEQTRSSRTELPDALIVRADREEPRVDRGQPEPAQVPPALQALPLAVQPEVRAMERFPALAEPGARQAPSVQVTIGRLIVEAVSPATAAAPQPAPRPNAPRLSLDDYLRQRRSQA